MEDGGLGWTRKQRRRNLRERKRGSGFSGFVGRKVGERGQMKDGEEEKGEQCGSFEPGKGWRR